MADYVYKTVDGKRYRQQSGGGAASPWELVPEGAPSEEGAKTTAKIGGELGYKPGGTASGAGTSEDEKYGKMTDAEIEALSPLMKASARARKKRYLAEEQARQLKK